METHSDEVTRPTAPASPPGDPRPWREKVRSYLFGPLPGEEVSPHVPDPAPEAVRSLWERFGILGMSAALGLGGALLIAGSAPVWYNAAPSWRLTVPGVPHPGSSIQSAGFFLAGLVALVLAWVVLVGRAQRAPMSDRGRLWAVVAASVVTCLPLLLSTPLLSHDSYSYAAQAEMASRGIDPGANGPDVLRYGYFFRQSDPIWRDAPAPYGPVSVALGRVVIRATGHDAAATVWGFRALAVAGVALTGFGVAAIARRRGGSPAVAVALGVGSPLVLLHLIGGSHNDAMMMGLTTLGLAAFLGGRKFLGIALVVLATGVKVPAAAALVFMAWNWDGDPEVAFKRRVRDTALVGLASLGALSVGSALVGIGPGWIAALKNTGKILSTFSVSTKTGFVFSEGLNAVGLHVAAPSTVAASRGLGMVAAGVICVVLLLRSPRAGMVSSLGMSMLAVVILSPVVWPWYLAVGFALVAAGGVGRWRPSYMVVTVAATAVVWPTSVDPVKSLSSYQHLLTMLVVGVIVAGCWAAQRMASHLERRRAELSPEPDPSAGAVVPGHRVDEFATL